MEAIAGKLMNRRLFPFIAKLSEFMVYVPDVRLSNDQFVYWAGPKKMVIINLFMNVMI